ncbi:hypothetical protein [Actinoplanes utahensis]|uniref:hypothetical protein n=1 Tax=Actinoplanes utahensis TaxID=1869 RepID=UPI000691881E|nr:hypothetical protein [Actinoplanes utahensis]GIF28325.1 hypothetical protein Aut01nite_13110 [Actinoplanes utahensis]
MRLGTVAALGVLLAVTTAGCATSRDDGPGVATAASTAPQTSGSAPADDGDAGDGLAFARCMREQGLEWFPDPKEDGRMEISVPKGSDGKAVEKAHEACKEHLPNGGEPPKLSAEDLERERKFAACMRDNGVSGFPDPDPDGRTKVDSRTLGAEPGSPTWNAAEKACSQYRNQGEKRDNRGEQGA